MPNPEMKAGQLWRTSTGVILLFLGEDGMTHNIVLRSDRKPTYIAYQGAFSNEYLETLLSDSVYIGSIEEFANLLKENYNV